MPKLQGVFPQPVKDDKTVKISLNRPLPALIPLMARVVQVADSFDAMIAQRSYNNPRTNAEALAELRAESGTQFDPYVVEAFLDTFPERS